MFVEFRQGYSTIRVRADEVVAIIGPSGGPGSGACRLALRDGREVRVDEPARAAEHKLEKAIRAERGAEGRP